MNETLKSRNVVRRHSSRVIKMWEELRSVNELKEEMNLEHTKQGNRVLCGMIKQTKATLRERSRRQK